MRNAFMVLLIAMSATRDSDACSCVGQHLTYLSPVSDDAPTNSRVRVEGPVRGTLVLRAHGGADVATQLRTISSVTELVPGAPLAPSTRYELAVVDSTAHPPTTVIGTFKTGTAPDTTAPRLDNLGHQGTHLNPHPMGSACQIAGPWITLTNIAVHDERDHAQLAFGVWSADTTGRIDTQRPPDAILFPYESSLTIGQASACDPHSFAFHGSVVNLAVAAIDEAGNTSRALRFRADLTHDAP